jgi:hypothetical protein
MAIKFGDQSLRSPLKVAIIPTFRGIVAQVRIFRLKMAKKAFSAEIFLLEMAFLPFLAILNTTLSNPIYLDSGMRSG